ncbi:hypothetical protein FE394_02825 [Xenorhabdus sp. Reich]|uniref:DUF7823 domain-containing protein n=1 Tax=Xenorhabdus littoralis TaxID=2582835 RepID=A0ABU4SHM1_9GAMM|nr:hypothetical protein [Xenorhabdus sp. Reich]MDX7998156.1 hypothetical protein [Xenorhabdus sp. Reich]
MSEINEPKIDIDNSMLVIDVTLGTALDNGVTLGLNKDDVETRWGYLSDDVANWEKSRAFGFLIVIKNNIVFDKTIFFYWSEFKGAPDYLLFYWGVQLRKDEKYLLEVLKFFIKKVLYVTVDDITYNLGRGEDWSEPYASGAMVTYSGTDAQKLSTILKKTGETKRFYCNWYDK